MAEHAKNRSKFTLYLEGIEIPFNSITITETEGNFPSASIKYLGPFPKIIIIKKGVFCVPPRPNLYYQI